MEGIEVVVGRIGKPHGIRGEVTVDVRSDEPEKRFADGARLRTEAPRGSAGVPGHLTVARTRWHQGVLLVAFEEAADRNVAETLRGTVLHVTLGVEDTPEDPDEFYDHQLVGLAVHDLEGVVIGEVTGLVHGGAQDLLAVRATDGRATLVPEVDLPGGRVVVADRPGLVAPLPDED